MTQLDTSNPPSDILNDHTSSKSNTVNICPSKIGNQIWYYPRFNRVLKKGPEVKVSEADAMRLLSSKTRVPVPQVYASFEKDGRGYIIMAMAEGQPLWKMWDSIDEGKKQYLIDQLSTYVQDWRRLSADYYGSVGSGPCGDVFFQHLPAIGKSERTFGPYASRSEYNEGLIEALRNARPDGIWGEEEQSLADRIRSLVGEQKTFSHGDLYPDHIFVDNNFTITAIIDWGASGFSIPEREAFEATSRDNHPIWIEIAEAALPHMKREDYIFYDEFNEALRLYSGI
ncbi:kinase-like protein [Xylona heveae TC161]|uniref:Kinase-like protein n=1 Tax=Xylona heveae (strain CBS 132557 / TC161) TaxID=1328760 RepID=A0A165J7R5_XYLHT|nr:kinase-like protein [Xylona heveae TC161]KZF25860.1 kinase-like protein [Xylona heveae TC161]